MSNVTGIKRRAERTRFKLKQIANGRPRLTVHRTPRHIYAQLIDDAAGKVIVSASTLVGDVKTGLKYTGNVEAAKKVGETIGKAASAAKIKKVVFDRGSFKYHGRIKALADAAREAGLEF
jgi:large subunit ribosomal protein L18